MSFVISVNDMEVGIGAYHLVLLTSNVSMQLLATLNLTKPSKSAMPCKSVIALPSTFNSLRFVKQANSVCQLLVTFVLETDIRKTESS